MSPYAIYRSPKSARCSTLSLEPSNFNSSGFPVDHLFFALDSFKIGMAVLDRHLRFRAVNPALAKMNGLAPDDHVGKSLHAVLGALSTQVGSALEHVFSTGEPLRNVKISGKLPMRVAPGQWIQCYFPLLCSSSGRVLETGAFVREVEPSPAGQQLYSPTPTTLRSDSPCSEFVKPYQASVALSVREREVLRLLATGECNKEISAILGISVKTVESYRSRMTSKLGVTSLAHLIHYAIAHGVVDLRT